MATYTSIPAFTSGQVLTSSVMNDVKNNLDLSNAQSAYPYRNLIYNGAMQITQRAAVGSAQTGKTTSGFYTADRFEHIISSLGTWTDTTIAEAPTGSGFRNSFKVECTTADASPAAGDYMLVRQQLEGQDLQRIAKGTSSAQALVLTFWVRSNVTGTYVVELQDLDNTRSISKSYTVSASATWEKKEITFAADTTGVLDNDNAASMSLNFWLGAGTTYTSGTLATSWGAQTNANRAVGQTNLASATSQYWQITGVQLEVGSVSTPFEFLPFGDELARCQRYYYRSSPSSSGYARFAMGQATTTAIADFVLPLPVPMRTAPTSIDTTSTASNYGMTNAAGILGVVTVLPALIANQSTASVAVFSATMSTASVSLTAGHATTLLANNNSTAFIGFSAEL